MSGRAFPVRKVAFLATSVFRHTPLEAQGEGLESDTIAERKGPSIPTHVRAADGATPPPEVAMRGREQGFHHRMATLSKNEAALTLAIGASRRTHSLWAGTAIHLDRESV
jgi:hypothetical protein